MLHHVALRDEEGVKVDLIGKREDRQIYIHTSNDIEGRNCTYNSRVSKDAVGGNIF